MTSTIDTINRGKDESLIFRIAHDEKHLPCQRLLSRIIQWECQAHTTIKSTKRKNLDRLIIWSYSTVFTRSIIHWLASWLTNLRHGSRDPEPNKYISSCETITPSDLSSTPSLLPSKGWEQISIRVLVLYGISLADRTFAGPLTLVINEYWFLNVKLCRGRCMSDCRGGWSIVSTTWCVEAWVCWASFAVVMKKAEVGILWAGGGWRCLLSSGRGDWFVVGDRYFVLCWKFCVVWLQ